MIKNNCPNVAAIAEIAEMFKAEKSSWVTHLRIADMLIEQNQMTQAKKIIGNIAVLECFMRAENENQIYLMLKVYIATGYQEKIKVIFYENNDGVNDNYFFKLKVKIASYLLSKGISFKEMAQYFNNRSEKINLSINTDNYLLLTHFLKDILSHKNEPDNSGTREILNDLVISSGKPVVEASLGLIAGTLMRRMEDINVNLIDHTMSSWIAAALYIEYQLIPFNKESLISLSRWMAFTGNVKEIVHLMNTIYEADEFIDYGYTYLSIFLWMKGYNKEGFYCYKQERFQKEVDDPILLFLRAVLFSIFDTPEGTAYWLSKLYQVDGEFFMRSDIKTFWGFLVLILNKIGQERLSVKAQSLAEKHDLYYHFRKHLWQKIHCSLLSTKFPPFLMPDEFNK